jgi:hypothetical protein
VFFSDVFLFVRLLTAPVMATELALLASALFGVGVAYSRRVSANTTVADLPTRLSALPKKHPEPAESRREGVPASMRLPTIDPNPMVPGRRRDNSVIDRGRTLEDQQPWLRQNKPKREVPNEQLPMPQDNVLVRSQTRYTGSYIDTMERPIKMHGVNPVGTSTGTAGQLVGPGIMAGKNDLTGDQGLHYGMVRMRPTDVHNHFREQKGSIVPGKSNIDKPTNSVPVEERTAAMMTFGQSGHVAGDPNKPQRFFAVSEEYQTSAPGRAIVTGTPGAGGQRLEPNQRPTNRGHDDLPMGHGAYAVAQDDRAQFKQSAMLTTDKGHMNEYLGVAIAGATSGLTTSSYNIPLTERNSTECARGDIVANLANPGQPGAPGRQDNASQTQRGTINDHTALNLSPQAPDGTLVPPTQLRDTQRLNNELRMGAAGTTNLTVGSQGNAVSTLDGSRLSNPTQREATQTDYVGGLKSVGVNGPMSYADVLQSEGYSVRGSVDQSGYSAPANSFNSVLAPGSIGNFEASVPQPNFVRNGGGGVAGLAQSANTYLRNDVLESHPNRQAVVSERLDPRILDALTKNEFALASRG